jgi:hypothetical protein
MGAVDFTPFPLRSADEFRMEDIGTVGYSEYHHYGSSYPVVLAFEERIL